MDAASIVEYIKQHYPKVIFNPVKFAFTNAIGFIITNGKIIIGFINKSGGLCKLGEPLDLATLTQEQLATVLQKIPVVDGFTEVDKTNLMNVFNRSSSTVPKEEYDKLRQELERQIQAKDAEYNVKYDSVSNQMIMIQKKHADKLDEVTKQYEGKIAVLEENKARLLQEKDELIKRVENFEQEMKEYIKTKDVKIEELENIFATIQIEKQTLERQLQDTIKLEEQRKLMIEENKDDLSNFTDQIKKKDDEIERLQQNANDIAKKLKSMEEELSKSQMRAIALEGYKERCQQKLISDKNEIVKRIKEYNTEWTQWSKNVKSDFEGHKKKLIADLRILQQNLKLVLNENNQNRTQLTRENKILQQNIKDIQNELKKTIADQLIKLNEKDEQIKMLQKAGVGFVVDKDKASEEQILQRDNKIRALQKELEEVRKLLAQNNKTKVDIVVDYDNCYSILQNFFALNNIFYRKQEVMKRLDAVIYEGMGQFKQLDKSTQDNIKGDYEKVKASIQKHIKFLDLEKYIRSQEFTYLKSKATRNKVPKSFCEELTRILDYWNTNKGEYREQDRLLTNIYEDLSGAVRVYVRIKPLIGIEQKSRTVSIQTIDNAKQKSVVIDCTSVPNIKNNVKQTFGEFYGVFEQSYSNIDVYTGVENTPIANGLKVDIDNIIETSETVSPGLYSAFKQVEDGYSIVVFGYGLSGSGKCHGKGTEIMMYDGSIKKVEDIKEGELLMGDDSTPRRVLSLARGKDMMYEISNNKGDKYVVNSEHILSLKYSGKKHLRDRKKKLSYQVCNFNKETLSLQTKTFSYKNKDKLQVYQQAKEYLENINEELVVDVPLQKYMQLSKGYKPQLRGYKVPVDFKEQNVDLDPYMLGIWLGDGHTNDCYITNQDATVLKYFNDNLNKYNCYLSFQQSSNYAYRICTHEKNKHHEHSNYFKKILHQYNLLGNKHIPQIYKCNSRDVRLKLLAGLIDSDGHLDKNGGYEITQSRKRERLLDDIIYLCRSLGFACYKNVKKTSWTYKDEHKQGDALRIHIYGKNIEQIPTLCQRKKNNIRRQIKDPLVSGIQVTPLGHDEYYGFELDGNHRYVLGNFTVTHNTFTLLGSKGIPGLVHYGLANLQNVGQIRLKYLFEQYIASVDVNFGKIRGRIHNLIGEVPQMREYARDERPEFAKRVPNSIKLSSLQVSDLYPLTDVIDEYRIEQGRIKQTPNNPVSSRSHLYFVFEITFTTGKTGYVTIVDTAGRESPIDIFRTFIDTDKTQLASIMSPAGGESLIMKMKRESLDPIYTPAHIFEVLKEGFYINETINHLVYFFNKKNYRKIKVLSQATDPARYAIDKYYVSPDAELTKINNANNCLTIPIMNFLDTLSNKNKSSELFKPTKFIMMCMVRQEERYCDQIFETLQFAQNVKSS